MLYSIFFTQGKNLFVQSNELIVTLNKLTCTLIQICVKYYNALIKFFMSIYFNVLNYLLFFNKFSQIITVHMFKCLNYLN